MATARRWVGRCGVALLGWGLCAGAQAGFIEGGRPSTPERDAGLRIRAGVATEFKGLVQETRRVFYDVSGQSSKQADAETYGSDDFGMDGGYPIVGFGTEKNWRYTALQLEFGFMNPSIDTEAKRNYYLAVGEDIEYGGRTYDHLLIPEGTPFEADFEGGAIDLKFLITPLTMNFGPACRFTPNLNLGIFGFAGNYDIEAGPVRGVTTYQNPPEYFTIGGSASGFIGMGLPEAGLGGELRFGAPEGATLAIRGHYAVCQYDGSSSYVVSSSDREKDLDIEHVNIRARCELSMPLRSGRAVTLGVEYQKIASEGLISSAADGDEEILAARERFDKWVEFDMESLIGSIGLTF